MSAQPDLPDLGSGSGFEHALLARAFQLLLADGRAVSPTRLAEALAAEPDRVGRALALLDRQGRIRRNPSGAVVGSHGLSVTPTQHELLLEQEPGRERRYWTWCAWDAVGILAALDASGQVRSASPTSGAPIQITFDHGHPQNAEPGLVVFLADTDCCTPAGTGDESSCCASRSVIDDWCPLVNFFEDAKAAQAWAALHGMRGTAVPLDEATDRGRVAWRRWIADRDQPGEPADQVDSGR
jgi:Alkylmercury lyase